MALLDLVKAKVKDDSGRLTEDDDYLPAIAAALERYSGHRPLRGIDDLVGDGTADLALPDDWEAEFSRVLRVEYPVGLVPESLVPAGEWSMYRTPDAEWLRLIQAKPPVGEAVRVTYTLPRTEASVVKGDLDAVADLAASICSATLANLFAQTSDPTIAADAVNYRTKSAEFSALAKRQRQLYLDHFGITDDGGPAAAWATAEPSQSGRIRLTH